MQLAIMMILAGSALLAWSANRFVVGASVTARNMGISPLIIGITIIGFATSMPEMLVAAMSAWQGDPVVGVGSAIGSNIVNIGLVLGISALFIPLEVESKVLRDEFPLLLATVFFTAIILSNGFISLDEGFMLLFGFIILLIWLISTAKRTEQKSEGKTDRLIEDYKSEIPRMKTPFALFWLVVGFIVLIISSRMLVHGAVFAARHFGVSDLVIGLTIVAFGTSLPELATSITSVLKNEHEFAIGNIIGSCMFNLLAVLAMPGLIHPTHVPNMLLWRDFPVMFLFTLALFWMAYGFHGKPGRITRLEGSIFLAAYVIYLVILRLTN